MIETAEREEQVLRECLYALQGTAASEKRHGERSNVVSNESAAVPPSIPPSLCASSKLGSGASDALSICAEAGWLFTRVQAYVDRTRSTADGAGSIQRALASALALELLSYQQFLAQLQTRCLSSPPCPLMHLRHILIATQAPIQRLQSLAALTDCVGRLHGPRLLIAIHEAAIRHGDSRHRLLVQGLLARACRPWFDLLYLWATQGVLTDPAQEFFVTLQEQEHAHAGDNDCRLWTERYRLDYDKVPLGVLDYDLIEPAFTAGKGINYIRSALLDGEWSLDLTPDGNAGGDDEKERLGFAYTALDVGSARLDATPIRRTLQRAAQLVHSHILSSLHEKYSLLQHFFALKQFLLLGQGDFFSALMDLIHQEFHGRDTLPYRHSLAAIAETALRTTNAISFSPDILGRLQVELLLEPDDDAHYQFGPPKAEPEFSSARSSQRSVWDVFLLEYRVPDPLQAIVHPQAEEQYRSMFRFLFRLRKVEFLLNLTWRQSAVLQHALQTTARNNGLKATTSPEYAQSLILLRHISMTRQAMMHFVVNLKSYLMFEVLEGNWKELLRTMQQAETLDQAIQAHDDYLNGVCRKSLLAGSSISDDGSAIVLGDQVKTLIDLVNEFCTYQEQLLGSAIDAYERAEEKRRVAEHRLNQGQWMFSSEKEKSEEITFYGLADEDKLVELDRLSSGFRQQVLDFLHALDGKVYDADPATPGTPPKNDATVATGTDKDQGDLDALRFLHFQLDCNRFYSKSP